MIKDNRRKKEYAIMLAFKYKSQPVGVNEVEPELSTHSSPRDGSKLETN